MAKRRTGGNRNKTAGRDGRSGRAQRPSPKSDSPARKRKYRVRKSSVYSRVAVITQGTKARQSGDYARAAQSFNRILERDGPEARILVRVAQDLVRSGQPNEAEKRYLEAAAALEAAELTERAHKVLQEANAQLPGQIALIRAQLEFNQRHDDGFQVPELVLQSLRFFGGPDHQATRMSLLATAHQCNPFEPTIGQLYARELKSTGQIERANRILERIRPYQKSLPWIDRLVEGVLSPLSRLSGLRSLLFER